jgi:hypothetical protein
MKTPETQRTAVALPILSRNRSTDQNNPFNEDREAHTTSFRF